MLYNTKENLLYLQSHLERMIQDNNILRENFILPDFPEYKKLLELKDEVDYRIYNYDSLYGNKE